MYRIKDPRISLPFYSGVLGMTLLQKLDFPAAQFSLYFMGWVWKSVTYGIIYFSYLIVIPFNSYENPAEVPKDTKERTKWAMSRKATVELTQ